MKDRVADLVGRAQHLIDGGDARAAVALLTESNRRERDPQLEVALVGLRLRGAQLEAASGSPHALEAVKSQGAGGELIEVTPSEMDVGALREGWARAGCLVVRGLVDPQRAQRLADGIDSALSAWDAAHAKTEHDRSWYQPQQVEDRAAAPYVEKINRDMGALWTVHSPRMLDELFATVDETGVGRLMTEFLGERPFLSANKCTLRRVQPEDMPSGWHQDGAFLGDAIGSFNFWLTLSPCGVDAPGLDIVPLRFDHVLRAGEGAIFKWSLSDEVVTGASGGVSPVRPQFEAGDAVLFDHRLIHRTASSASMPNVRYAIESWFFAPSAYPKNQTPLLY